MKRMMCVLLCVLLFTGCNKAEEKTTPIDPLIWGYDYNVNQIGGSFAGLRSVTESEAGIYFKIINTNKIENNNTYLFGYFDKKSQEFSIVDASGSAQCSLDMPSACTSYSTEDYNYLTYYNEHLYFIESRFSDSGISSDFLVQMDLDGTNRHEVVEVSSNAPMASMFSMVFHRGNIYFTYGDNTISRIDMSTWSLEKIVEIDAGSQISLFSAFGESVMIEASVYSNDDTRVSNAVLALDINDHHLELIEENLSLYQMKGETYVVFDDTNNTINLYNAKTEKLQPLKAATGSVIMQEDYIVIGDMSDDPEDLFLFDYSGSLLSTYTLEDGFNTNGFVHAVVDGYCYFYRYGTDSSEFIRVPIVNQTFGEPETIAQWKGSIFGN